MSGAPRYGLIADVHGNLQALDRVFEWLDEEGVDATYCLGDVVGYGGDPAACLARVRERCAATVQGNHDRAVVEPALLEWFNPRARAALARQGELLDDEGRRWLAGLPRSLELGEVALGHSGFADPLAYTYVDNARAAAAELAALRGRWGFLGHTHVPAVFWRTPEGRVESLPVHSGDQRLDRPGRFLVNPGAVGQPRDGDPRAGCATFDLATGRLRLARLAYDVAGAQTAIRDRGLPSFEALRLGRGL